MSNETSSNQKTAAGRPSKCDSGSEIEAFLTCFKQDRAALERSYPLSFSSERIQRLKRFFSRARSDVDTFDFQSFGNQGKADVILISNLLNRLDFDLDRYEHRLQSVSPLMRALQPTVEILERHQRLEPPTPQADAGVLHALAGELDSRAVIPEDAGRAHTAVQVLTELAVALQSWRDFYRGYDPQFSWWVDAPYRTAKRSIKAATKSIQDQAADPNHLDVAPPVGKDVIASYLRFEMIAYSPEELLAIGEQEFDWCSRRLEEASRELGLKGDAMAAIEHVKTLHEPPGGQPQVIKSLAIEAIKYVHARNLLTVPEIAAETWRMGMMSPEKQKTSPFFLGGEMIQVSFPTDEMPHDAKEMSMRGNNSHFSRATVQHELIPGHHLQAFMERRHNTHRSIFRTCFWIEGWTLYWEMLLWDMGFPRGPEDRVGMLFWRMHRCARVIFSLKYHLGQMSAQECVDLLIDRVGHERANAEGEVRRSFKAGADPLYQAAYMLGGLQVMAMRRELVDAKKLTERDFHDAFLRQNQMPMEMMRAILSGGELQREFIPSWRFYPALQSKR